MSEKPVANKRTFEVEVDGKKTEFSVVRPNHGTASKAELVYNKAWREAVEAGSLVRQRVEKVAREQNLWDDAKQAKYVSLLQSVAENELKLAKGGMKLSEARQVALDMRRARAEMRGLLADRNQLDLTTAESVAEKARFNYLVAACTVYENGKPYYRDADDFLSRDNDPVGLVAATEFGKLFYGLEDDFEKKLPENRFLVEYGFVNDDLHLIRKKDGRLIDAEGRLVDAQGRLVNEAGELVDRDGNLLNENGDYKVQFTPFVDDTDGESAATKNDGAGTTPTQIAA